MKKIIISLKKISIFSIFSMVIFFFVISFYSFSKEKEKKIKTDEDYWINGMYFYADRSYTSAAEQFELLTHNFPYSKYAHDALLMELHTNYINKELEKIPGIAEVFYRLFPTDNDKAYVLYIQAMSEFSIIKQEDKARNSMIASEQLFRSLIKLYPDTIYAKDAMKKLKYLQIIKQLNEINSAEVFEKQGKYVSAIRRYTGMFNIYNEDLEPEIEERLLCRLVGITQTLRLKNETAKYYNKLQTKFPNNICKA